MQVAVTVTHCEETCPQSKSLSVPPIGGKKMEKKWAAPTNNLSIWRISSSVTCLIGTYSFHLNHYINFAYFYIEWDIHHIINSHIHVLGYVFIKNVVAVAAYSRLASRSQAKFHTKKLSPLVRPCAAAPGQNVLSRTRMIHIHNLLLVDIYKGKTQG